MLSATIASASAPTKSGRNAQTADRIDLASGEIRAPFYLDRKREIRLQHDGLAWSGRSGERILALQNIETIRLYAVPGLGGVTLACTVAGGGERLTFMRLAGQGLAITSGTGRLTYRQFVTALLTEIARTGRRPRLVAGGGIFWWVSLACALLYVLALAISVLLLIDGTTTLLGGGALGVLLVGLRSLGGWFGTLRRGLGRTFAAASPPEAFLKSDD